MKLAKKIKKIAGGLGRLRRLHRQPHGRAVRPARRGFLLEEGCSPQQVDEAIEKFGMAMGPFRDGRPGRQRHRLGHPQAPLRRAAELRLLEGRRPARASWAASARRPARAGTTTSRADRDAIPDPDVDEMIEALRKRTRHQARARSPTRRSSSADLRAGQRGARHPRGRHRAARLRHRHGLPHRLRLPALPRRADVLCRHGRACSTCAAVDASASTNALQGAVLEAGAAAREARAEGKTFNGIGRSSHD